MEKFNSQGLENKNIYSTESKDNKNWKSAKAIATDLGIDWITLENRLKKYRISHPNDFEEREERGGYKAYSPKIVELIKTEIENRKDWKTRDVVSRELGIAYQTLEYRFLKKYRINYPDDFEYRGESDGHAYYSPRVIENIRQEIESRKNWITVNKISQELGVPYNTLENRYLKQYCLDHPDNFEERGKQGTLIYYNPEVLNFLQLKEEENKKWKTSGVVAQELGIQLATLKRYLDKHHIIYPDDFEKRGPGLFLSPKIIELIKVDFEKRKEWKPVSVIAGDLGTTVATAERDYLSKFRNVYPDDFEERGEQGFLKYYSPKIFNFINSEKEKQKEKKNNWKAAYAIAKDLKIDQEILERDYLSKFRKIYPSDIEKEGSDRNKYYLPKVQEFINSKIKESKNWKLSNDVAQDFGISLQVLKNDFLDKYRNTYPGDFEEREDNLYISSRIINLIKDNIVKVKKDQGWVTVDNIAKDSGIDQATVKKYYLNKYRTIRPDYFLKAGNREYYSPELKKNINIEVKDHNDWRTLSSAAKYLGISPKLLDKYVDQLRLDYPSDFEGGVNRGSHTRCSPKLIEIIKKELENKNKNILESPENWQSTEDISERMGISKEEIEKIAKRLREKYQGQFGKFKDRKI